MESEWMSTRQWYYSLEDGRETGPVTSDELFRLARSGVLKPQNLVWNSKGRPPVRAHLVKGLFSSQHASQDNILQQAVVVPTVLPPPTPRGNSTTADASRQDPPVAPCFVLRRGFVLVFSSVLPPRFRKRPARSSRMFTRYVSSQPLHRNAMLL